MGEAGESPALSRNGNTTGEVRPPALYDPKSSWKGKLGTGSSQPVLPSAAHQGGFGFNDLFTQSVVFNF